MTCCARLFWPFHASVPDAALNRIESDRASTDTPLKLDSLKPWYEKTLGGVLSFNHAIGDKWLVFARTGWAEDGGSLLERSV